MNPISLASGVLPDCSPEATVDAAAAAGFDAVGLWIDPATWTDATTRGCARRLADAGPGLLDVEVAWLRPGALDPAHLRMVDIGAELGARHLLVVSSDPDMDATAAKIAALCDHARPAGLRIALEFALFTEVRSIAAAQAVLDRVGDPLAALLIDPLHLARTGGAPADVAEVPRARLPYAQFCDAPAAGPPPDDVPAIVREALDGRLQAGEGALPLDALLDALPADVPLSVELRSKPLRDGWPDPAERARVTAAATRAFLRLRAGGG